MVRPIGSTIGYHSNTAALSFLSVYVQITQESSKYKKAVLSLGEPRDAAIFRILQQHRIRVIPCSNTDEKTQRCSSQISKDNLRHFMERQTNKQRGQGQLDNALWIT